SSGQSRLDIGNVYPIAGCDGVVWVIELRRSRAWQFAILRSGTASSVSPPPVVVMPEEFCLVERKTLRSRGIPEEIAVVRHIEHSQELDGPWVGVGALIHEHRHSARNRAD